MDVLLVAVIVTALLFDFTNGFHDTANVVATSISTRAVPPNVALAGTWHARHEGARASDTTVPRLPDSEPPHAFHLSHRSSAACARDREPGHTAPLR